MLLRPGFEPVPVEQSKTWDSPDNCWLAKNVGNQGEGLIEGSIYDYTVGSIESTDLSLNHKYKWINDIIYCYNNATQAYHMHNYGAYESIIVIIMYIFCKTMYFKHSPIN